MLKYQKVSNALQSKLQYEATIYMGTSMQLKPESSGVSNKLMTTMSGEKGPFNLTVTSGSKNGDATASD